MGLLFSKNWQKFEYKTAPKVQKFKSTRQASIEEFMICMLMLYRKRRGECICYVCVHMF